MKSDRSQILAICFALILIRPDVGAAQQSPPIDLLPFEVGKEWTYSFSERWYDNIGRYGEEDTGTAVHKVAASIVAPDSIRWSVVRIRDFIRTYKTSPTTPPPPIAIHDSSMFEVVERTSGLHELVSSAYRGAFPFWHEPGDTLHFFRFATDSVSRIIPNWCLCKFTPTLHRTVAMQQSVGVTLSAGNYVGSGTPSQYWSYTLNITTEADKDAGLPAQPFLYQNYPNPFNPSTLIRFDVPQEAHATLKVYDLVGREVATLADAVFAPGSYARSFDGMSHSSGIYICRLNLGGFRQTIKLLLVR